MIDTKFILCIRTKKHFVVLVIIVLDIVDEDHINDVSAYIVDIIGNEFHVVIKIEHIELFDDITTGSNLNDNIVYYHIYITLSSKKI